MSPHGHLRGFLLTALGVTAFSLTFPATRLALGATEGQTGGFDPLVVGFGRTAIAIVFAAVAIWLSPFRVEGSRIPRGLQRPLLLVALGNGLGFGALTALALKTSTAAHGAVVVAGLPIATAIVSVIRQREHPSRSFWAASIAGTGVALVVTVAHSKGGITASDLLLLAAVGIGALGYAEGGRLAQKMPGMLVIAWSVVFAFPIALVVSLAALGTTENAPDGKAWLGLAYVSAVSMFLGFLPFYRGLADVGVTRGSQVQLIQPLLTIGWSALLLGEVVGWDSVLAAIVILLFVFATQRARIGHRPAVTRVVP
jgi:drug/metabolite transporter (DMT)-like permease